MYCNWDAVHKAIEAAPTLPRPKSKGQTIRKRDTGGHIALVTFIIVARHLNRDTGETFLSYETIAREALVSLASVWRAVDALVGSGHLLKLTGGKGKRDCNTYSFGPAMNSDVHVATQIGSVAVTPLRLTASAPPPSPVATELAERFTELLNQHTKHSTARRKNWPGSFDKLLRDHSHTTLHMLMEWVFNSDTFWAPKFRDYSGDPMAYFVLKLDKIMVAKDHRTLPVASRNQNSSRNPSSGATFNINTLLAGSTI